jgi:hypothetical protein
MAAGEQVRMETMPMIASVCGMLDCCCIGAL